MIAVESVKYARVGSSVDGATAVSTVRVPPLEASDGTATGPVAVASLPEPALPPAPCVGVPLAPPLDPLPPPQAASVMRAAAARTTAGFFIRIEVDPPFLY